jgi:hypothetical protein
MGDTDYIWVFVGEQSSACGGVFSDLAIAENWILQHSLSGLLSQYPLNEGVFDWAVRTARVKQKFADNAPPQIIGSFCSYLHHYHYKDGKRVS